MFANLPFKEEKAAEHGPSLKSFSSITCSGDTSKGFKKCSRLTTAIL